MRTYDAKGRLRFRQNYKYDLKGNLIEEITRKSTKVIGKKISKLDLNGASKEVAYYDAGGSAQREMDIHLRWCQESV